jgi:hypothetical protein
VTASRPEPGVGGNTLSGWTVGRALCVRARAGGVAYGARCGRGRGWGRTGDPAGGGGGADAGAGGAWASPVLLGWRWWRWRREPGDSLRGASAMTAELQQDDVTGAADGHGSVGLRREALGVGLRGREGCGGPGRSGAGWRRPGGACGAVGGRGAAGMGCVRQGDGGSLGRLQSSRSPGRTHWGLYLRICGRGEVGVALGTSKTQI